MLIKNKQVQFTSNWIFFKIGNLKVKRYLKKQLEKFKFRNDLHLFILNDDKANILIFILYLIN
ncbi:MAG: hypothetical protein CMG63_01130 [Candidatus Marinimicrobia bacterium]|nr:hypothetical protein [Candidatus Neomarinimicrobiota bacterium]